MDADKSEIILKTMQLLQERTPPQNPGMDEPVRRTSRRIKEKQNQDKNQILSPKCLTFNVNVRSEVKNSRKAVKRKKSDSEEEENVQETQTDTDRDFPPGYREGLSKYELERLENIRQNQAFLSSLKLPQISISLRPKPKPTQKGLKKEKTEIEMLPVRKSLRLQNKGPSQAAVSLEITPSTGYKSEQIVKKAPGPIPLDPINLDEDLRVPEDLLNLWNEVPLKQDKKTLELKSYQELLQKLSIKEGCVVKVVKERICSAAFHPSASSLLMAAGDSWGNLGLWKPDAKWGDDGVLCFEPHSRTISSMAFSSHPCNLITVSYDGSARSMDLEKAVFDEVYRSNSSLRGFDFLSNDCSTLLLSEMNGDVVVVDRRTPGLYESLHTMTGNSLRTVHVHPVQQHYFVVAESSFVNIYDLRHLKRRNNQAVCELNGHGRIVSSAFFSPLTGNRVLTSCLDNMIRIFDTSQMDGCTPLLKSIAHNMQTGRWLTRLSAVWDPKHQECFVIGSMERPRQIQVYHESGRLLHTFRNMDHLNSVCSVTAFHPSRNTLLGGNSSGRMHLFTNFN